MKWIYAELPGFGTDGNKRSIIGRTKQTKLNIVNNIIWSKKEISTVLIDLSAVGSIRERLVDNTSINKTLVGPVIPLSALAVNSSAAVVLDVPERAT